MNRAIHKAIHRLMDQRKNLEISAVQSFIRLFNAAGSQNLTFDRLCEPPMPDTVCRLDDAEIGIEVAHTYGTDEEAARRLGNRQWEDYPEDVHLKTSLIPLNERALESLNGILIRKARKRYAIAPTWLLIRNAFFFGSVRRYQEISGMISIPEGHPFAQVWLLCDESGSLEEPGIIRLA